MSRPRRTSSARTSRTSTSSSSPAGAQELQQAIRAEGLKVTLHPGGELAHEDALALHDRELQLIAQGPEHAQWLLLECPFRGLDDEFDAAVERLTALGYGLLLAHPERIYDGDLSRLAPHTRPARSCRSTSPACSAPTARTRGGSRRAWCRPAACTAWPSRHAPRHP